MAVFAGPNGGALFQEITVEIARDFVGESVQFCDKESGEPLDLTGYVAEGELREGEDKDSAKLAQFDLSDSDLPNGVVNYKVAKADAGSIQTSETSGHFDIVLTSPGTTDPPNFTQSWIYGIGNIQPRPTDLDD